MRALDRISANLSYALGLRAFLRQPMTPEQARRMIEARFAEREQTFLRIAQRAFYANRTNPYARLLDYAGIHHDRLAAMVQQSGLEGALKQLFDAGVYVTLDEFKGRQPVRRGSLEFATRPSDFDNPVRGPHITTATSGSRGSPVRAQLDFEHLLQEVSYFVVMLAAYGMTDRALAMWRQGGVLGPILYAKAGKSLDRSFSTLPTAEHSRRTILFNLYTTLAARFFGHAFPPEEYVPRDRVLRIVEWLAEEKRLGRAAALHANTSPIIRICRAARDAGVDISGTLFHLAGEPYTPAKAAIVASVGARAAVGYAMVEAGVIGHGCGAPSVPDDVHVLTDKLGVIQREQTTAAGETVGALYYTGASTGISKLLLNFESGDYADLEQRDCDCLFGELGFSTHLSNIRSYEKLTSEGVTFVGSELYELLETVLPSRFGGGPMDYQLVEEESADGVSSVNVVVAPGVGPVDEAAVVETILNALKHYRTGGGRTMSAAWRQGQILRVVRRPPYETRTAKVQPLHVLRASTPASEPPAARPH